MKNTHDPFDDELRNRLEHYSEEPADGLWAGISSNIETVKPPFAWTKWISISSAVVVVTGSLIYFSLNETVDTKIVDGASASVTEMKQTEDPVTTGSEPNARATNSEASQQSPEQTSTGSVAAERSGQPARAVQEQGKTIAADAGNNERNDHTDATRTRLSRRAQDQASSASHVDQPLASRSESDEASVGSNSPAAHARVSVASDGRELTPVQSNEPKQAADQRNDAQQVNNAIVSNEKREESTSIPGSQQPLQKSRGGAVSASPAGVTVVKDSVIADPETVIAKAEKEELKKEDPGKDETKKSDRRLSLYLTAMPTFGYQRIEANQNDNVFIESISKVSNFSTKRLGVRAEIGAEYALSPKFRVFGGVLYYQRKQTIEYMERVPVNEFVDSPVDTVVIIQPEFTSKARTFEYELRNIGVQVGMNYVIREKKFLHTIGTGVEFHKALNKLPESEKDLGFSSNPSTYVFANLYYRLQYPAQGRLRAVFQPTFNYSLYLNQDMNAPFFVKPYGLGLNIGLTYHF